MTMGTLISLNPIAALVSRIPMGIVYREHRARLLIALGVIAMGITNFLYGFASDSLTFAVVHLLNGFAYGAVTTLYMAFYVDSLPEGENRNHAMGYYVGTLALGYSTGNFLGGGIADWFGYAATFRVAAFLSLVPVALLWLCRDGWISRSEGSRKSGVKIDLAGRAQGDSRSRSRDRDCCGSVLESGPSGQWRIYHSLRARGWTDADAGRSAAGGVRRLQRDYPSHQRPRGRSVRPSLDILRRLSPAMRADDVYSSVHRVWFDIGSLHERRSASRGGDCGKRRGIGLRMSTKPACAAALLREFIMRLVIWAMSWADDWRPHRRSHQRQRRVYRGACRFNRPVSLQHVGRSEPRNESLIDQVAH